MRKFYGDEHLNNSIILNNINEINIIENEYKDNIYKDNLKIKAEEARIELMKIK